ncbi:MAG: MFS transporter [Burkholderiales bacterium]|nr:MFS transporter [Burkholderiales bacterium]
MSAPSSDPAVLSPSIARPAPLLDSAGRRALVAVLLAVTLATLDTAIANTALPTIAAELQAAPAASIWVINAYQLAVAATLLPFAALGDLHGPRRVFLGGLVFFTLASLGCALAPSLPLLAAARALQGAGAGALMSVNIALIRQIYPPDRLGRGVGMNALVVGIGFAVGPSVASLVLALASWPWLFAINVPLGLVAFAFASQSLPRSAPRGHRFDPLTALFTSTTFAALIFGLACATQREPAPLVAATLAVALVAGALLLRRQAGHPAPMLPVDLLRRPVFALSVVTALASFSTQGLAFVSLPFFFQGTLHRNAVDTGLLMTPWPLVVALAAPFAGRLSDRYPPGLLGGIGLAILAVGMASLALLPAQPAVADIVWRMMVCGAGFGFFQSPNLKALMSSAPPERSGGASGMIAIARMIGQTTGAALVALCFGLAGAHGPIWALALGAGFAAAGSLASSARLFAR